MFHKHGLKKDFQTEQHHYAWMQSSSLLTLLDQCINIYAPLPNCTSLNCSINGHIQTKKHLRKQNSNNLHRLLADMDKDFNKRDPVHIQECRECVERVCRERKSITDSSGPRIWQYEGIYRRLWKTSVQFWNRCPFFLCLHSHISTQQSVTAIPYCLIPGELQMYYAFLSMYVYVCVSELNKVRNINVKVTYI